MYNNYIVDRNRILIKKKKKKIGIGWERLMDKWGIVFCHKVM